MTLRDEAIEAMAKAVWPNDYKTAPQTVTELCEVHLDALLTFLTDHRDEAEIAMHDVMTTAEERGDEIDYMQAVVGSLAAP